MYFTVAGRCISIFRDGNILTNYYKNDGEYICPMPCGEGKRIHELIGSRHACDIRDVPVLV